MNNKKLFRLAIMALVVPIACLACRYVKVGQKCAPESACEYGVELREPVAGLVDKHPVALAMPLTLVSVGLGFLVSRSRRMS